MQENKKTKPTHFIEQFRDIDDNENDFEHTEINEIKHLDFFLNSTKDLVELKTVCIFLITPKQKP